MAIALVLVSLFINSVLAKKLPSIEGIVLLLHVSGFIAILAALWALGPHSSSREVFNKFNDGGDWHSMALAALVGILSPTLSLIGPDAVVHVSEEVRNASKTVPQIMLATALANGILGFVMLITICFCLGNLDDVLSTPTGYPFIQVGHHMEPMLLRTLLLKNTQVFYNATRSNAGATTMTCILVLLAFFCAITNMATASRQLWSFARDQGVPFNILLAKVNTC